MSSANHKPPLGAEQSDLHSYFNFKNFDEQTNILWTKKDAYTRETTTTKFPSTKLKIEELH